MRASMRWTVRIRSIAPEYRVAPILRDSRSTLAVDSRNAVARDPRSQFRVETRHARVINTDAMDAIVSNFAVVGYQRG